MGRTMSDSDAELAFQYLRNPLKTQIAHESLATVHDTWIENRPDDYDRLSESVRAPMNGPLDLIDDEEPFNGDGIKTTEDVEEEERTLLRDLVEDYRATVRSRMKEVVEETRYSPREFVALVLDAELTEAEAAEKMNITVGNFRGKKGDIRRKRSTAERTLTVTRSMRLSDSG